MSKELLTKLGLKAWNNSFEISELRKDKARLDWLMNKSYAVQLKDGAILTSRADIDKAMEAETNNH